MAMQRQITCSLRRSVYVILDFGHIFQLFATTFQQILILPNCIFFAFELKKNYSSVSHQVLERLIYDSLIWLLCSACFVNFAN